MLFFAKKTLPIIKIRRPLVKLILVVHLTHARRRR
jgi:hypothetical protein